VGEPIRKRLRYGAVGVVLVTAAVVFLLGIRWGLPSRAADGFLFGDRAPWSGQQIVALAPAESDQRGADVDANPIARGDHPVVLNETDAHRAEIVRRYRLFSYQPDEMITLKSLSRLPANRGDPRLYQYGGLWIYPVAILIKSALNPRADQAWYLDHPEEFGRFYVVARAYCAFWGVVGTYAIFWIVRRATGGGILLPTAAAICFVWMPVVLNMAHEAKPHLPGAVLVLLTVMAASKYVETGARKWFAWAGVFCGAAAGMILVGAIAFAVVAVMVILRRTTLQRSVAHFAAACGIAILVYAITNPFVVLNAISRPERLRSNVGNTTAMYAPSARGVGNGFSLVCEGASAVVTATGIIGVAYAIVSVITRRSRRGDGGGGGRVGGGGVGWLLAAPALLILVPFLAFASNKPAEYARFALLFDLALLVAAFALLGRLRKRGGRVALAILLVGTTILAGAPYLRGFILDCRPITSRLAAAERMRQLARIGADSVRLTAEPAPYSFPPVDLFRYRLLLARPGQPASADVVLAIDTRNVANPISWANARFAIVSPLERRREWHPASMPAAAPATEP
jgi:hypothetical protein